MLRVCLLQVKHQRAKHLKRQRVKYIKPVVKFGYTPEKPPISVFGISTSKSVLSFSGNFSLSFLYSFMMSRTRVEEIYKVSEQLDIKI